MRILDKTWKHELFQFVSFVFLYQFIDKAAGDNLFLLIIGVAYLIGYGVSHQHQGYAKGKVAVLRGKVSDKA